MEEDIFRRHKSQITSLIMKVSNSHNLYRMRILYTNVALFITHSKLCLAHYIMEKLRAATY